MKVQHFFQIILVLVASLLLQGCYEKPSLPFEPSIRYVDIQKFTVNDAFTTAKKDSVIINIFFQDGNGDLGLDAEDIEPPSDFQEYIKTSPTDSVFNPLSRNYKITALQQNASGDFEPIVFPDPTLSFDGRFQRLSDGDKQNPIEGTLSRRLNFFHDFYQPNTVLKFLIRIQDRSKLFSNEIETDTVVIRRQ